MTPLSDACYMSDMTSPATAIRFRPAEKIAINEALTLHRKRTGKGTRLADAIRFGCAAFCASEGVPWPADDKELT